MKQIYAFLLAKQRSTKIIEASTDFYSLTWIGKIIPVSAQQ